jgi:hypothetical protein
MSEVERRGEIEREETFFGHLHGTGGAGKESETSRLVDGTDVVGLRSLCKRT